MVIVLMASAIAATAMAVVIRLTIMSTALGKV